VSTESGQDQIDVEHAWPQAPQSLTFELVSTQEPLQSSGSAEGHPVTHE
jgi:hypothetical protein